MPNRNVERQKVGKLVDVKNRGTADELLSQGFIGPRDISAGVKWGQNAPSYTLTRRYGIWLMTSNGYSGGRVHMYQYAWCLANLGAEVWMITNATPRWKDDYPFTPNIRFVREGKDAIPKDFDYIVTDSKAGLGACALRFKKNNPQIPFICFNFETPNWVAEFDKSYASKLQAEKGIFVNADHLIANSQESRIYLLEWLEKDISCDVLNPAVNTFGIDPKETVDTKRPARPYFLFSARAASYKGGRLVIDSIWKLKEPVDLVTFGRINNIPRDTEKHKYYALNSKSDVEKFALMRDALAVLAPSRFEGYGMVPGEALAVGTEAVVYDLPVLREAYGDRLTYVKWNDSKAFSEKVSEIVKRGKRPVETDVVSEIRAEKGMDAMMEKIQSLRFHAIKRKSVSAHCIAYWGFVPESVESIYEHVDEIIIAYGPTALNADVPPDGSLEYIHALDDPDGKIRVHEREVWADKLEMRSFCTERISGNYNLMLDGDEVWMGLDKWIESHMNFSCPRWINLWHSPKHWIYDSAELCGKRWGRRLDPYGSVCPHYRFSFWRPSYKWRRHPAAVDANGKLLHCPSRYPAEEINDAMIYHLGHILSRETMRAKHEFYRKRDGDNEGRRKREKVWHDWNGQTGDVGDGIVETVTWDIPDIVERACARVMSPETEKIAEAVL